MPDLTASVKILLGKVWLELALFGLAEDHQRFAV